MTDATEDDFCIFFLDAIRYLLTVLGDQHKEWVLFQHGSLYFQIMPNNQRTKPDKLIQTAKNSLSKYVYSTESPVGDVVAAEFQYKNHINYFIYTATFDGLVFIHPSKQITDETMAIAHGRYNIKRDKDNQKVITTGSTQLSEAEFSKLREDLNSKFNKAIDLKSSRNFYLNVTRLKLLNQSDASVRFLLEKSPFSDDDDDEPYQTENYTIVGQIFPTSEIFEKSTVRIQLQLGKTYPVNLPRVHFLTPVNHPNVNENGELDHELLKCKIKWTLNTSLVDLIKVIVGCLDH
ncbi:unnamed protein product [Adineta ricciae]|uniref:UBC core domain-containing protein n=1 Tax=Adineta ricciae TaxID=249248 RepID=A0A815YJP2_ADIRI|nr:unnamed protein product [Adineta ricciae]CAF1572626.1 unnamed protein product [Adineta ricciae]